MPLFTAGHALIIGVSAYRDERWRTPVPVADAKGVAEALTDPEVSAYPPEQVHLLLDAAATRDGVTAALRNLGQSTAAGDTVTIFYAGHGALGDDGRYYFATQDTVFTQANTVQADTGVSGPELVELLRDIKAQKLLVIANTCFSGHLRSTLGPGQPGETLKPLGAPPSASLKVDLLNAGEGRAIITASRPAQESHYDARQANSFFGEAIITGLRGGASASEGYIGLYGLYQYAYNRVRDAASAFNARQEPVLTLQDNVGSFPVAHFPGATPGMLGAPSVEQPALQGTSLELIPSGVVTAFGQTARFINESGIVIIDKRKVIDFGGGNTFGNVNFKGDVAEGNIIKITVTSTALAQATTDQAVVDLIGKLRSDVADLTDVGEGEREDVGDELRKAKDAGVRGDHGRMLSKLESAQAMLIGLGQTSPTAIALSEAIGAVLQRAKQL